MCVILEALIEPICVLRSLEAQLSETMRNIFKGTKAGEDYLCPNCKRKRYTSQYALRLKVS